MAQYDDLNGGRIALVGVISVVVTAVTALAVQVAFYAMASYNDTKKQAESDYRRQNEFLMSQETELAQYGVDPSNANVTIPIEKAMELVVAESHSESHDDDSNNEI
ncbi:hypothetical protein [Crateriforma conspicua]|uniref:Uncharacterized protein n=1 Tax=Crateriforma conspicua TaxID=2527996 RepID=A0A5C5Y2B0_9PLAN|nr:hypothetical protein [Crateriforma conspicua]QDV62853.1 hypothetical protein Mal65_19900 [Crateriforma conspicua]TWT68375.1 hypothetical protein Pan14r_06190 [Crateriforma conspicua]